ncbi:hypothetical protein Trydic_g12358 [Trypoxylus dichotomus]
MLSEVTAVDGLPLHLSSANGVCPSTSSHVNMNGHFTSHIQEFNQRTMSNQEVISAVDCRNRSNLYSKIIAVARRQEMHISEYYAREYYYRNPDFRVERQASEYSIEYSKSLRRSPRFVAFSLLRSLKNIGASRNTDKLPDRRRECATRDKVKQNLAESTTYRLSHQNSCTPYPIGLGTCHCTIEVESIPCERRDRLWKRAKKS